MNTLENEHYITLVINQTTFYRSWKFTNLQSFLQIVYFRSYYNRINSNTSIILCIYTDHISNSKRKLLLNYIFI